MGNTVVNLSLSLVSRMRSITRCLPKTLIPVSGRLFADYQIRWFVQLGVIDLIYSIGLKGLVVRDYVVDGSAWRLRVRYEDEGERLLEIAGAFRLALEEQVLPAEFMLTCGDSFLPVDSGKVFQAFQKFGRPALMTVFRNDGPV